jgi:NADPH-dependent curcumin reductase CurA
MRPTKGDIMEKKIALLSVIASLMIIGLISGYKSNTVELELCRRQARQRLRDALVDDAVTKEEWQKMLFEEVTFLESIAKK